MLPLFEHVLNRRRKLAFTSLWTASIFTGRYSYHQYLKVRLHKKTFTAAQEALRKNVERNFRVKMPKSGLLAKPCML